MPEQLFEFLTWVFRAQAEILAAAVVGFVFGILLTVWFLSTFRRRRVEESRLRDAAHQERVHAMTTDLVNEKDRRAQVEEELTALSTEHERLQVERNEQLEQLDQLQREVDTLNEQVQDIVDSDGRVWERPATDAVPQFIPRLSRRATIISLANLKGGVGKTTLSANLGATLAAMGQDVLLIDLDHQHSLSDLCFNEQQRGDLKRSNRLIDAFFGIPAGPSTPLLQCIERVDRRQLHCVVSDEHLSDVETRLMASWLVGQSDRDVRYLLRDALHDETISDRFDYIILDCPPRLTTTSINALAASDFVLIPAILDATSMNAVPRMVHWLHRLKHEACVCTNVALLGVVANCTQRIADLTTSEQDNWTALDGNTSPRWSEPVYFFQRFIPRKAAFGHAAGSSRFACERSELNAVFLDLATELRARIPVHESRRSSAVSEKS